MSKSAENGFGAASRSVLGDGHISGLPQSHLIISLGGLEVCDAGHRLCDEKAAAKIASRVPPNALLGRGQAWLPHRRVAGYSGNTDGTKQSPSLAVWFRRILTA